MLAMYIYHFVHVMKTRARQTRSFTLMTRNRAKNSVRTPYENDLPGVDHSISQYPANDSHYVRWLSLPDQVTAIRMTQNKDPAIMMHTNCTT